MVDTVNVGSGPNSGTGDPLLTAYTKINTAIANLQAVSPTTVTGLNTLTLSASTVAERVAQGTAIGTISGKTTGTTVTLEAQGDYRFQVVGTALQVGPMSPDPGTYPIVLRETLTTGSQQLYNLTTLSITVTTNAGLANITPTLWAAPTVQGTGDGLTAANANSLINIAAGAISSGAIIGVRADLGDYVCDTSSAKFSLSQSGSVGNPIKFIGCNSAGHRQKARFTGGRVYVRQGLNPEQVNFVNTNFVGFPAFQLTSTVDYMEFEDLLFQDVGICFNTSNTASVLYDNIALRKIWAINVQRLTEHNSTNGFSNFTASDIVARGFSKVLLRFRGISFNGTITNLDADCERQDGDNWGSATMMDQTAHDLTITNGRALNVSQQAGPADYWNADSGGSTEEFNYNVTLTNFVCLGATDAAFDNKASNFLATDCTFGDSKRNFKNWGTATLIRPVFTTANKRGGTGGACNFNILSTTTRGTGSETKIVGPCDITSSGYQCFVFATNMSSPDANGVPLGTLVRLINVTENAVANDTYESPVTSAMVRFMRAAAAPSGAITVSSPTTLNVTSLSTVPITILTNRDASHGGVFIRSITGTHASSFLAFNPFSQSFSPLALAYSAGGGNTKSITVNVEDINGNTLAIPYTITIVADSADHRVLDITFTGANGSQTAADASPTSKTMTYGASALISTTIDAAGRLRSAGTSGNGAGKVSSVDSPDWLMVDSYTIIASGVRFDATASTQVVLAQWGGTGARSWQLYINASGQPCFDASSGGTTANFTLQGAAALTAGTDYDFKVTRVFSSGSNYRWALLVNGSEVATVTNSVIPQDAALQLSIGCNGVSQQYMAGYIKRIAIYKGGAVGS